MPRPPFLSVDIGGGSCDVAAVDATGIRGITSVAVGSGVLAARDLDGDPPSLTQVHRTAARLGTLFKSALPGFAEFPEAVATGGAARRVRRQLTERQGTVTGQTPHLLNVVDQLLRAPTIEWPHPVKAARAATARAGGMILRTIMIRWHVVRWRVSPYGLREGALALLARGESLEAAAMPYDAGHRIARSWRVRVGIIEPEKQVALTEARRFFNRELSQLQFNERVLDQARPEAHPLLERLKFLAISDSSLDEFLSINFSLLLDRVDVGDTTLAEDGHTATEEARSLRRPCGDLCTSSGGSSIRS